MEDEEEADRRLAFEGNYDEQEGQGDSDSDRHNQGQESDDGLIEILDSSGDEENEQQEEMMNQEEEDESSEGEMSNETDDLNEAVDNYIAKEEEMKDGEVDDDHDKTVATSTEITERVDAVASAREDQHDAEILKEAVHEYIIPSTGAKAGDVKETGENNPHEMSKTKPVIEGNTTLEVVEKKITGADVAQNEAETPSIPAAENTSDPAHETTDTDDVILADDEHESIDTEDDRRSLGDVPPFDDTKEGEDKDDKSKSEENCEQNDKEESKDEGERGEKPSLLVAAAMSTQRQGNNFDQSSTPNRFELPPEKFYDELLQEKDLSFDDTSAAMVASHNLADADDLGDDSSEEDDGYVPDVEVSEAERAYRETEDAARKKAMVDDGYIPDASEASEVEQIEDNGKRSASRDVRFETSLESKAGTFDTAPSIDAAQSIDEGYLPDESEVERGGEALVRHTQGIDRGYVSSRQLSLCCSSVHVCIKNFCTLLIAPYVYSYLMDIPLLETPQRKIKAMIRLLFRRKWRVVTTKLPMMKPPKRSRFQLRRQGWMIPLMRCVILFFAYFYSPTQSTYITLHTRCYSGIPPICHGRRAI